VLVLLVVMELTAAITGGVIYGILSVEKILGQPFSRAETDVQVFIFIAKINAMCENQTRVPKKNEVDAFGPPVFAPDIAPLV